MEITENKTLTIAVLKNSYSYAERAEQLLFKKDETYREHFLEAVKDVVIQFRDAAHALGVHDEWSRSFYYNIGTLSQSISWKAKIQMAMSSRNSSVSTFKYINDMKYSAWVAHHVVYALISGKTVRCECPSKHPIVITVIKTVADRLNIQVSEDRSKEELFLLFESLT